MQRSRHISALATLVVTAATVPAMSAVLLSEDFSYPDGALTSVVASPTWGVHSGTGSQNVVSGRAFINDDISADHNTRFANTTSDALYAGFTASVASSDLPTIALTATNGYFLHLSEQGAAAAPALSTNFRARVWAVPGTASGTFRFGLSSSSGVPTHFTSDLLPDTDYRVIVSYDFATHTSQLWLDPVDGNSGATLTGSAGTSFSAGLGAVALRSGVNTQGDVYVDDLIVATTLGEAIPEPATVGLLGLGMLLFRRRKTA